MSTHESIVVGVDFTSCSRAALAHALRLASESRPPASVRVVHVIDRTVAEELASALGGGVDGLASTLTGDARRRWTEYAAGVPGAASLTFDAVVGGRVGGLVEQARTAGADLLVLGAYGDRKPNVGFGSVAAGCVRRAPCDVLLVRENAPATFRNVLVATDFSPTSLRAIRRAARLALREQATLRVLHVFDAPWRQLHYRAPTPEASPQFQRTYRDSLERRLRETAMQEVGAVDQGLAARATVELLDRKGERSAIVEAAQRSGADLIVIGTHGRTHLKDLFLGSVAEATILESSCSVLAVKPEEIAGRRS
ncbi:MAG TPA: universal stress protein [Planctomycetota bacterium]|nr:universal stress protein [Planctomycetota bacterium]